MHPACLERKFVVFVTETDLRQHTAREHGEQLSKAERRQAMTIPLSIAVRVCVCALVTRGFRGFVPVLQRGQQGKRAPYREPSLPPCMLVSGQPAPCASVSSHLGCGTTRYVILLANHLCFPSLQYRRGASTGDASGSASVGGAAGQLPLARGSVVIGGGANVQSRFARSGSSMRQEQDQTAAAVRVRA
jgi:hypothetical protein